MQRELALRGSLSGGVFFPDICNIVSRLDPFFAEAARGTKISGHLGGTKNGASNEDIVSGAKGASLSGNANDLVVATLWANLGILHLVPLCRRDRAR
jgi:hypothetical protein